MSVSASVSASASVPVPVPPGRDPMLVEDVAEGASEAQAASSSAEVLSPTAASARAKRGLGVREVTGCLP